MLREHPGTRKWFKTLSLFGVRRPRNNGAPRRRKPPETRSSESEGTRYSVVLWSRLPGTASWAATGGRGEHIYAPRLLHAQLLKSARASTTTNQALNRNATVDRGYSDPPGLRKTSLGVSTSRIELSIILLLIPKVTHIQIGFSATRWSGPSDSGRMSWVFKKRSANPDELSKNKSLLPSAAAAHWRSEVVALAPQLEEYLTVEHPHNKQHEEELAARLAELNGCLPDVFDDNPNELDKRLQQLVGEHAALEGALHEAAVLACLHRASDEAAIRLLLQLRRPNSPARYVRCLSLAAIYRPSLLSKMEMLGVRALQSLLEDPTPNLKALADLVGDLWGEILTSSLLKDDWIGTAMTASHFGQKCKARIEHLLQSRQFSALLDFVRLLSSCLENQEDCPSPLPAVLHAISQQCPWWDHLCKWKPSRTRLRRWKTGASNVLNDVRQFKLRHIFDLEGPDLITGKPLRRSADPGCFLRISIEPKEVTSLDKLLNVLDTMLLCGEHAVDLFIQICIDSRQPIKEYHLRFLERAAASGNLVCRLLPNLLIAIQANPDDILRSLTALTRSLHDPELQRLVESRSDPMFPHFGPTTESHIRKAQALFREQLRCDNASSAKTADILTELLVALARHEWTFKHLGTNITVFLAKVSTLDKAVKAATRRIGSSTNPYAASRDPSKLSPRLREVIQQYIRGEELTTDQEEELRYAQIEAEFWSSMPSTKQIELARTIGDLPNVEPGLYASCLNQIREEDDLVVLDLCPRVRANNVHSLASYLAQRASHSNVNDCWVLLLGRMIHNQGSSVTTRAMESLSLSQFLGFIDDIRYLVGQGGRRAVAVGEVLRPATGHLNWWTKLSGEYRKIVLLISEKIPSGADYSWLLMDPSSDARYLLDSCQDPDLLGDVERRLLAYLSYDGSNISQVTGLMRDLETIPWPGTDICARLLDRLEKHGWGTTMIASLVVAIQQNTQIDASVTSLLDHFIGTTVGPQRGLMGDPLLAPLAQAYEAVMDQANILENTRAVMKRQDVHRVDEILTCVGVKSTSVWRRSSHEIPDSLVDVVDIDIFGNYQICFPLTALSELQRKARGVSQGCRAVIIHVAEAARSRFCIHTSDDDDDDHENGPCQQSHTALYLFNLSRFINFVLSNGRSSVEVFHSAVAHFIREAPSQCIVCSSPHQQKRWSPTTCSQPCIQTLSQAPAEVRLAQLFTDPLAFDLLLCSAYAAATDTALHQDVFLGCPVPASQIRILLDSLPDLDTLVSSHDGIDGLISEGVLRREHGPLLGWLGTQFRGLLLSAPSRLRIPSFPTGTHQFALLSSSPEREAAFAGHAGYAGYAGYSGAPGGAGATAPVFHGTKASRLLPILLHGLAIMSGTTGQVHGAARGQGVYCADEPSMSQGYAGSLGNGWGKSRLKNLRVLLACELASNASSAGSDGMQVVNPAEGVIVRYVFLVPAASQLPKRRHVDTALKAAYAQMRTAM
jgi:hypothetical protein